MCLVFILTFLHQPIIHDIFSEINNKIMKIEKKLQDSVESIIEKWIITIIHVNKVKLAYLH